jgi:hypothetical protein
MAVAVDPAGDIFVGDDQQAGGMYQSSALYFIPAGSTTATLKTAAFNLISGLALDAAGNLYLANAEVMDGQVAIFPNGSTNGSFTFGNSPQYSILISDQRCIAVVWRHGDHDTGGISGWPGWRPLHLGLGHGGFRQFACRQL